MTHRPVALCIFIIFTFANARLYKKCELARELQYVHKIEANEIPVWICIAKHESNFNTSAVNIGSGDHGLFQISDLYWCSKGGQGRACNAACSSFEDDDISDDVQCIRRIFNEHKRLSGNGFNAWVVYPLYCKNDIEKYAEGCFDSIDLSTTVRPTVSTTESEDEYEFPPLPVLFPVSTIRSLGQSQKKLSTEFGTQKYSLFSTTPLMQTKSNKSPVKHEAGSSFVSNLPNLGYYVSTEPAPATQSFQYLKNDDNKRKPHYILPHQMRNFIFMNEHQKNVFGLSSKSNSIEYSSIVNQKFTEELVENNLSLQRTYKQTKYPLRISLPSKSQFASNAAEARKSVEKTKLGSGYVIERNGRGFRLRLE